MTRPRHLIVASLVALLFPCATALAQQASPAGQRVDARPQAILPTVLVDTNPDQDQYGVPERQPTALFFSQPLDASTIAGSITAEAGGMSLVTTASLSLNRKVVTLTYMDDLPPDSTINVTVDGGVLRDVRNEQVDADGDGQPGGVFVLTFHTMLQDAPVTTGLAVILGTIFDETGAPLPGATIDAVYYPATDSSISLPVPPAISAADGTFAYTTDEITGTVELLIRIRLTGYSESLRRVSAMANGCWRVEDSALLPLTPPVRVTVAAGATLQDQTGQIELIIPPGALTQDSDIGVTMLPSDAFIRDELPPLTAQQGVFVDVTGVFGDETSVPVTLLLPNTYGLPLGTKIPFGKIDHNTLEWTDLRELSEDPKNPDAFIGEVVVDPGGSGGTVIQVVFTHFCTVCTGYCLNTSQGNTGDSGDDCGGGGGGGPGSSSGNSVISHREGYLWEYVELPSFQELGEEYSLALGYFSAAAKPSATLTAVVDYDSTRPVERTFFEFDVEGVHISAAYGFSDNDLKPHATFIWDGHNGLSQLLPTGSYPYVVQSTSLNANARVSVPDAFGGPPSTVFPTISYPGLSELPSDPIERRAALVNLQDSPYGAGWSLLNEARLHFMPDGCILVVEGNAMWREYLPDESTTNQWGPGGNSFAMILWNGVDAQFERYFPNGRVQIFNPAGRIVSDQNRFGLKTTYAYSGDLLVQLRTPTGFVVDLLYDANDKLRSISDSGGRSTGFSIDASGDLVVVTSAEGGLTTFAYDTDHLLQGMVRPGGDASGYQYTGDRVIAAEAYDTNGSTLLRRREFSPSVLEGEMVSSLDLGLGFIDSPIDAYENWIDERKDGRGVVRSEVSNYLGLLVEEVNGLGHSTSFEYDENQLLFRMIRPNGSSAEYGYDSIGMNNEVRQYTETGALYSTSTLEYNGPFHEVTRIVNSLGNEVVFSYDAFGNLTGTTDPDQQQTTYDYQDPSFPSLPSRVTLPTGEFFDFTYDSHGNPDTMKDYPDPVAYPLGRTTSFSYDVVGNLTVHTDSDGRTQQFGYDNLGRTTSVTDGLMQTTSFNYRDSCNCIGDALESINFHDGTSLQYGWDGLERMVSRRDQFGIEETYQYDAEANLLTYVDRNGAILTFEHDAEGQLLRRELPGNDVTLFTYDELGSQTKVQDGHCVLDFEYDFAARPTLARTRLMETLGGGVVVTLDHELTYDYDKTSNRASMTSSLDGVDIGYTYDDTGRLETMALSGSPGGTWTMAYDVAGRRTSLVRAAITSSYTYDAAGQLESLSHSTGSTLGHSFSAYGGAGDALEAQLQAPAGTFAQSFVYDENRRLTGASYDQELAQQVVDRTYTVDAANRLISDGEASYTYDAAGRLAQRVSGPITETYTHDADGRLLTYTETIEEGGVTETVLVVDYLYDPLGRRIAKTVNGVIERFVYDGGDVLHKLDGKNRVELTFVHGPGEDELIAVRDSVTDQLYEVLTDRLGTPVAFVDAGGTIVDHSLFDEYGTLVSRGGLGVPQPYGFTGRQIDFESGLHYYRARYYDGRTGRFLTEDPTDVGGGLNLYAYAAGNPVSYTDPTGELPFLLIPLFAAGASAAGDVLWQLAFNGGRLDCVDLGDVAVAGVLGAVGGAAGAAARGAVLARRAKQAQATAEALARTQKVQKKGEKFLRGYANRNPFGQSQRQIGRFTEFGVNVPGRSPGSYTRWIKTLNENGKTIRLYHDTFDKTGRFLHRGIKVPGPTRHVY